jgi:hypothetical protein
MLTLGNDQLVVSILDPIQDQARLGSRYCTGGYVYDVTDRRLGAITSGPGYPDEVEPPVFDGQGLPEAFPSPLWIGGDPTIANARPPEGTTMLILGVGFARAASAEAWRVMPVEEFCLWQIEQSPTSITMETRQNYAGWTVELTRVLKLANRTLVSETRLANVGRDPVPFRWFPHPFFPNPWGECCKFNFAVGCPENPGYDLAESGYLQTKLDHAWDRVGHFLAVEYTPGDRLVVLQKHPKLGLLVATCSYVPSWLPVWANKNTFSFEPYLQETVAPGQATTWSITYDF